MNLEVNDVPLLLCYDLDGPKLGMISWRSFFFVVVCLFLTTSSAFLVWVGKLSIQSVNVSIVTNTPFKMTNMPFRNWHLGKIPDMPVLSWISPTLLNELGQLWSLISLGVV